jgi:hypothetical protein
MDKNFLIIISFYEQRRVEYLQSLINQILPLTQNFIVVINSDSREKIEIVNKDNVRYVFRPNIGMNIGAWYCGCQLFPEYSNYIFLQDECVILNTNFIQNYLKKLNVAGIGLTGESINNKWNLTWAELSRSSLNYNISFKDSCVDRVSFYLSMLRKWGINPGTTGRHMRSLIWALSKSTINEIGGFPLGLNKEECIASEIAISKKIESIGLSVEQVSSLPFSFVSHREWRSDGLSKIDA